MIQHDNPSARTGKFLSGLAAVLLALDSLGKLLRAQAVLTVFPLGLLLLACVVIYVVPRTAILGALLLTGYLGGAVATHVRVGNPLFTHILFPTYVAALIWGGLMLRDARLRALAPWRRQA